MNQAQKEHLKNVLDSLANRAQYECEKWTHTDATYGDTQRSAADVEYGYARAYEHIRDHVLSNLPDIQEPADEDDEDDFFYEDEEDEDDDPFDRFDCTCGAWLINSGKIVHVADCICGSSEPF